MIDCLEQGRSISILREGGGFRVDIRDTVRVGASLFSLLLLSLVLLMLLMLLLSKSQPTLSIDTKIFSHFLLFFSQ